jgi:N-acetylglutamate synthase-like GNAT family acetyltransferase
MAVRIEYLADRDNLLPQVARWQHVQFGYLNPAGTLGQRADRLRDALHRDRVPMALIAISEEGQLVGSASIVAATLTHPHLTPWLSSVFVPPEMRGRSTASALSLRAADEAARLGFKSLYLFTPHSESLYARLGWKTFDRTVHNGQPLTLMERPVGA